MLHDRGSITVVCPGDIAYVQADGKHVIVHASDGVVRARAALATLQGRLDPGRFVRIHRSSLVNVQCIREVIPEAHGDCQLVLLDGTRLTVSRRFRQGLAMLLGG